MGSWPCPAYTLCPCPTIGSDKIRRNPTLGTSHRIYDKEENKKASAVVFSEISRNTRRSRRGRASAPPGAAGGSSS
eukprot:scaffold66870_cov54-Phaeocystis_antarctica.AAC.3